MGSYSESYDAVVVGSGIAGPIAARNLARGGHSVLLLDKKYEIGAPKQCAEGIDIESLKANGVPIDRRFINSEIRGASIHSPSDYKFEVKFSGNKGLIVERKVFDKFLAHQAARAGADVMAGAAATGLVKEGGKVSGVSVRRFGEDFSIRARAVIAADGIGSSVARWAGINTIMQPRDADPVYEYEMAVEGFEPDMFYLYFGNTIAPGGYAWVFPKDSDRANVGIGVNGTSPHPPKYYLDRWLDKMHIAANKVLEINYGAVPVGMPLGELVRGNVAVVGDAARQLFLGGGMAESMAAAAIASKWAGKALSSGDISLLGNYTKEWWEERGKKIEASVRLTRILEKLSDSEMDTLAEAMGGIDPQKFMENNHRAIVLSLLKSPKVMLNPKIVGRLMELKPLAEALTPVK